MSGRDIRRMLAEVYARDEAERLAKEAAAAREGPPGPAGPPGPEGPSGPPPEHEWQGTRLRFEQPDGSWGEYVDLRGPAGMNGRNGGSGALPPLNTWQPSGWGA